MLAKKFHVLQRRLPVTAEAVVCVCKPRSKQTLAVATGDVLYNPTRRTRDYSEVPGPNPIPLLGNTWRFIPFIGNYQISKLHKVTKKLHTTYGDIVKISNLLGRPDMVFLFDPAEIEKVFRSEDTLPFRPSMPSLIYYKNVLRKDFFSDIGGLIATHGEKWNIFRSKVQQQMLQPRIAKLYIGQIEETADEFVQRIIEIKDENDTVPADFLNEIHKWALESIAKVALDVKLGCLKDIPEDTQKLIHALDTFLKNVVILELKVPFWKIFSTPTWKEYINALDTITIVVLKHINNALKQLDGESVELKSDASLLKRVLAQNGNNTKLATILALDLFLVGVDTTSASIASILYQLSLNKDKQNILYEELSSVLEDNRITSESYDKMPYLRACIRETLRMYPVVIGNGRCLTKDTEILGYNIPKGTQVVFQHYVICNSERYFDSPEKFEPERWLKESNKNYHPFASLPFGFGKRMCIGRRYADLEMQTLIAKIIKKFEVEYHGPKLDYYVHPMFMPNGPLTFTFKERH
ncbi:probable cytochrome P450 49a1 [Cimex lectularius]|uniref:Cytochrome P450 n=1 Tax=Cimex lectularius TaxID=79782 RepID=A0A8I6TL06_CIMLE|nr:probable cytochrome P450 49a1 [Cimex lectularius]XP_024085167.1 probable cytochrome P450 49a1 [Cimex lectularius]